jgi:hypothetical protein
MLLMVALCASCSGKTGPQGMVGPEGIPGGIGPQGIPGEAGTQFTIVQFCPNSTPAYPTTFPEVGFCIDNKVYAVYSANDGFLTEILPGTYESNAVGSSCTFTLLDNCVVK